MTPDDEILMAYADGELDALAAKRVERAIAENPALAVKVDGHRALRAKLAAAFPLGAGQDPLEAMVRAAPVPLVRRSAWQQRWMQAAAMAACLVIGVMLGSRWMNSQISTDRAGSLIASGDLARALDTQLAGVQGETNILVTFRDAHGNYCRVFSGTAIDGIACRDGAKWRLIRTGSSGSAPRSDYRQAASDDMAMMAAAQDMMVREVSPLQERQARQRGWKP